MRLVFCQERDEWLTGGKITHECDGQHFELNIRQIDIPKHFADMLDAIRNARSNYLDGQNIADELSDVYMNITGESLESED